MNKSVVLAHLVIALCFVSCVPSMTRAADKFLRPKQLWFISGALPQRKQETFLVLTSSTPLKEIDGGVAYQNAPDGPGVDRVPMQTLLIHSPASTDPEFLMAVYKFTDQSGRNQERYCLSLDPTPDQKSFEGAYATSTDELKSYLKTRDLKGFGTCRMEFAQQR